MKNFFALIAVMTSRWQNGRVKTDLVRTSKNEAEFGLHALDHARLAGNNYGGRFPLVVPLIEPQLKPAPSQRLAKEVSLLATLRLVV
eukprot:g4374.t1